MFEQENPEDSAHEYLRRQFYELATRQAATAPPAGLLVEDVLRQGRRHRRVRAGVTVAGAVACTFAVGLLTQSPTATGGQGSDATAAQPPVVDHHLPGRPYPATQKPVLPVTAVTGRTYPAGLLTMCGPAHLTFSGRSWQVEGPLGELSRKPRPDGTVTREPVIPGYITVTGKDSAQFEAPGYLAAPVELGPDPDPRPCV
jgi:hypothetical protein